MGIGFPLGPIWKGEREEEGGGKGRGGERG